MSKTKTNKPINNQNDAELRVSTNSNTIPTPICYDDVLESTGTKYSFPEVFETVDDQHTRVPGTDASTKGAWGPDGGTDQMKYGQVAMSRTDSAASHGDQAYQAEFGSAEMYRKEPDKQVLSVTDSSINTGSLSAGNRAANITPGFVGTAAGSAYDKAYRN